MAAQDNTERLVVVAAVVDERSRDWTVMWEDYSSEEDFRAAVAEELARFEHLGYRTGRALMAAPLRAQLHPGEWATIGWSFREAFVPAPKIVEAEQQAAEPVLEPAA